MAFFANRSNYIHKPAITSDWILMNRRDQLFSWRYVFTKIHCFWGKRVSHYLKFISVFRRTSNVLLGAAFIPTWKHFSVYYKCISMKCSNIYFTYPLVIIVVIRPICLACSPIFRLFHWIETLNIRVSMNKINMARHYVLLAAALRRTTG